MYSTIVLRNALTKGTCAQPGVMGGVCIVHSGQPHKGWGRIPIGHPSTAWSTYQPAVPTDGMQVKMRCIPGPGVFRATERVTWTVHQSIHTPLGTCQMWHSPFADRTSHLPTSPTPPLIVVRSFPMQQLRASTFPTICTRHPPLATQCMCMAASISS